MIMRASVLALTASAMDLSSGMKLLGERKSPLSTFRTDRPTPSGLNLSISKATRASGSFSKLRSTSFTLKPACESDSATHAAPMGATGWGAISRLVDIMSIFETILPAGCS